VQLAREPVHIWPEADALHRPLDAAVDAPQRGSSIRSRSTCHALACAS
jgi:hypothetical protein